MPRRNRFFCDRSGILAGEYGYDWRLARGDRFMVEIDDEGLLVVALNLPTDAGAVFRGPEAVRLLRDLLRFARDA